MSMTWSEANAVLVNWSHEHAARQKGVPLGGWGELPESPEQVAEMRRRVDLATGGMADTEGGRRLVAFADSLSTPALRDEDVAVDEEIDPEELARMLAESDAPPVLDPAAAEVTPIDEGDAGTGEGPTEE